MGPIKKETSSISKLESLLVKIYIWKQLHMFWKVHFFRIRIQIKPFLSLEL